MPLKTCLRSVEAQNRYKVSVMTEVYIYINCLLKGRLHLQIIITAASSNMQLYSHDTSMPMFVQQICFVLFIAPAPCCVCPNPHSKRIPVSFGWVRFKDMSLATYDGLYETLYVRKLRKYPKAFFTNAMWHRSDTLPVAPVRIPTERRQEVLDTKRAEMKREKKEAW